MGGHESEGRAGGHSREGLLLEVCAMVKPEGWMGERER